MDVIVLNVPPPRLQSGFRVGGYRIHTTHNPKGRIMQRLPIKQAIVVFVATFLVLQWGCNKKDNGPTAVQTVHIRFPLLSRIPAASFREVRLWRCKILRMRIRPSRPILIVREKRRLRALREPRQFSHQ